MQILSYAYAPVYRYISNSGYYSFVVEQTAAKIGVLLGQVGTPDAPTKQALLPYLRNFLSDPRVIDSHPLLWKIILHTVVLRRRPARSATLYKEIWTSEGSPLLVYSKQQMIELQRRLGDGYVVELGMAYGGPSIREAIARLEEKGIKRIVVVPLFPQFSTATTASVFDEVYAAASGRSWRSWRIRKKFIPALRFIEPYFDHPGYINALAYKTKKALDALPHRPDKFIITFHGIPKHFADEGDPYPVHCHATAERLAHELGWKKGEWIVSFQSRFGREEWIGPYTESVIKSLPAQGVKRLCVVAPAFVTDCLETLHELGIEGKHTFTVGGGDPNLYTLIPCLNDDPLWLDFLAETVKTNAGGWKAA